MLCRKENPLNGTVPNIDFRLALVYLRRQTDHVLSMLLGDRVTHLQRIWNRLFSPEQSSIIVSHVRSKTENILSSKIELGLSATSRVEREIASSECYLHLAIAQSLFDGHAIFEHLSAPADELDDASWQELSEDLAGVIRAEADSLSFPLLE